VAWTHIVQFSPDINSSFQLTFGLVLLENISWAHMFCLGLHSAAYCHFLENILSEFLNNVHWLCDEIRGSCMIVSQPILVTPQEIILRLPTVGDG
jgi:hypothetical protein